MSRLVVITGMTLLTACLIGWVALAWAQPSTGKLSAGNEVSEDIGAAGTGADPASPGKVPIQSRRDNSSSALPGSMPMSGPSGPPPTNGTAMTPQSPQPMQQLPAVPGGSSSPLRRSSAPMEAVILDVGSPSGPIAPGKAAQSLNSSPSGTVLPPLGGGANESSSLPGNIGGSPADHEEHSSVASQTSESLGNRQEPSVSLEWVGPSTAKIGQLNGYSVVVRNTCNIPVQQVSVRVRIPSGMTCSDTEPKAVAEGNFLVWDVGALQVKQEKILQMKLLADQKGDVAPQAWVTFTGSSALLIKVREPKLALKVEGPEKVLLGETAAFTLAVTNSGDGSADLVKIHTTLTEGLESSRGNKIDFEVGNLAAGETRNVTVVCMTKLGGTQKCEAIAEAEGGLRAKETTPVTVTTPRLDLQLVGPGLRYLGRKALFALKVTNPGDAAATNVTLNDLVPDGFKVLAASDGGRHDFSTHTVSWFLGEIKPGEAREVKVEVQAVNPGEFKHKANAVGAHNLCAESELTTRIEGLSALMLEMVDTEDPIEVNSETAYEVRVTNTGSKVETNIKLTANIPDKMEFKSATGPVRFHQEGKTLVFDPLEKLAPKADAVFRIIVKALDQGTVRFKIQMTSTNLTEPVIKMEATRIYSDAPDTKSSQ
jgi:uncharacterized repeat protein (TIGR01451 family)